MALSVSPLCGKKIIKTDYTPFELAGEIAVPWRNSKNNNKDHMDILNPGKAYLQKW